MYFVAKSYENLKRVGEPFSKKGSGASSSRMYVKVILANGREKEVRAYTEKEYRKMYPDSNPAAETEVEVPMDREKYGGQKHALGFDNGYITIFKGEQYPHLEWFRASCARYCTLWGWYVVSTDEVPADLPYGIEPVRLDWDLVGEGTRLKADNEVEAAVESLLYDPSPSRYQGHIGERLEETVVIRRVVELENNFGTSKMYIMEDEEANVYLWCTSAKNWAENEIHRIRGTVKEHKTYRNVQQTILTRCIER